MTPDAIQYLYSDLSTIQKRLDEGCMRITDPLSIREMEESIRVLQGVGDRMRFVAARLSAQQREQERLQAELIGSLREKVKEKYESISG